MDFIGDEQLWPREEGGLTDDDSFANGSSGIVSQLLMPVWAYQLAAVYLIFISIMGLITNIIVVVVILNDPQKMTPLNWMLLNLACSDGTIAGFGHQHQSPFNGISMCNVPDLALHYTVQPYRQLLLCNSDGLSGKNCASPMQ
ncbi:hypothetical protein OUZ56_014208 [Daphnia magna]|uniref:G-protein coupled receptors family 1 profile domain-containing protein n=1 Tax=Daphnia magna TaxID=35525 RepID=A0ABQ9Z870_9CRUS|nr:hypothetical protein OUZ56_014208 [Daphnia magna]